MVGTKNTIVIEEKQRLRNIERGLGTGLNIGKEKCVFNQQEEQD